MTGNGKRSHRLSGSDRLPNCNVNVGENDYSSISDYDLQMQQARRIAKKPKAEREAYWHNRQVKMVLSQSKKRKVKITLPTTAKQPRE